MKIYVSPSVQDWNKGVGSYGTEEKRMNQLADLVIPLLRINGFNQVYRNRPDMSLEQIVKDSNSKIDSNDLHVALHTNAGGGKGTEIFYYSGSEKGKALAINIYNEVAKVTPNPDRGIKTGDGFREINGTKGIAVILETVFHDNQEESDWMIRNMEYVAKAVVRGICKYANKPFKEGIQVVNNKPPMQRKTYFRVVAGSYLNEENAKEQSDKLKRLGIETFIDEFTK